jgi:hypothetical protein
MSLGASLGPEDARGGRQGGQGVLDVDRWFERASQWSGSLKG